MFSSVGVPRSVVAKEIAVTSRTVNGGVKTDHVAAQKSTIWELVMTAARSAGGQSAALTK